MRSLNLHVTLPLVLLSAPLLDAPCHAVWLDKVTLVDGVGTLQLDGHSSICFLEFGSHAYAPDAFQDSEGKLIPDEDLQVERMSLALFQDMTVRKVVFPSRFANQKVVVKKQTTRDEFWDQIITVKYQGLELPEYVLLESGRFGEAIAASTTNLPLSESQIDSQQQSLKDPHVPATVENEMTLEALAGLAYPLDFQKVLIASPHDSSPGFAFQNGQWFTTWLSRDLPQWSKEDHWFAPAVVIGKQLIRPAPLSAHTNFVTTPEGRTIPIWKLTWSYHDMVVSQTIFSYPVRGVPYVHVEVRMSNTPPGARLALGVGRRPNVHYWDDKERERTPIPFFTLKPGYQREGRRLVDQWERTVLQSAEDFELEEIGPAEMLLLFDHDESGAIHVRTPRTENAGDPGEFESQHHASALSGCKSLWLEKLVNGAQVILPDAEWMKRIDIWRTQLHAITRVNYQGQDRLSYGAYFYQYYFGPEEGWATVALAQWGYSDEAKRQTDIMLSVENRDKKHVHHQSRNGAFGWYAAEVARLTDDRSWLESITPALIENAEWTIEVCDSTKATGSEFTRGLLPPHIYGGDIRDQATSLYATMVCWKGLVETASVLGDLGSEEYQSRAAHYGTEAENLKARLSEVINSVADRTTEPPFLPLALALPSLNGKNEGPHRRLTSSRLGNYWNLFAPSVMELGLITDANNCPNSWLLEYMQSHGGLWAGLPRFYNGLDAAYSMGIISELLRRSMRDVTYRPRALATLQSFFMHAASRNGYTIGEVTGLFPYRLDAAAYEELVRQSPWNFGMYSDQRYLEGHISFTEPLGAAAGQALWLIRNALIGETTDAHGVADGGIFLLSTVPSEWYGEGKVIELRDFPTHYGKLNIKVESRIESAGTITLHYGYKKNSSKQLKTIVARFAPPGFQPQDIRIAAEEEGVVTASFRLPDN